MIINNLLVGIALSIILLFPLIIKWELDKVIAVPAMLIIGIISTLLISLFDLTSYSPELESLIIQSVIIIVLAVVLLAYRFYRDPKRKTPVNNNLIISPADGKIIYIKKRKVSDEIIAEKKGRQFHLNDLFDFKTFSDEVYVVGISMSFLDVHINRAPISGKIMLLQHIPGIFLSLKKKEARLENERAFTVIGNNDLKIGILQITSRLVRNIKAYIQENAIVNKGDKIGMIRFGSQVDLIIPYKENIKLNVNLGDKVKAGETIIAQIYSEDENK